MIEVSGRSALLKSGLPLDAMIETEEDKVKAVYLDYKSTVLVVPYGDSFHLLGKEHLKVY